MIPRYISPHEGFERRGVTGTLSSVNVEGNAVTDLDWQPTPHPVPDELTPEYEAATYVPPEPRTWATVSDQLDETMQHRLRELYGAL